MKKKRCRDGVICVVFVCPVFPAHCHPCHFRECMRAKKGEGEEGKNTSGHYCQDFVSHIGILALPMRLQKRVNCVTGMRVMRKWRSLRERDSLYLRENGQEYSKRGSEC